MIFREVYDKHFRFVWRALHSLGVPEGDMPDALQDVFIVVHRKLPEFEERAKITTWLFGISMRVASGRRRAQKTRREVVTEGGALTERADDRSDVSREVQRREAMALLERLVVGLPMEQRAVFMLFELEAMSGEAIAELLAIPLGTVHSRLRLAREGFRRALSRHQARDATSLARSEG